MRFVLNGDVYEATSGTMYQMWLYEASHKRGQLALIAASTNAAIVTAANLPLSYTLCFFTSFRCLVFKYTLIPLIN